MVNLSGSNSGQPTNLQTAVDPKLRQPFPMPSNGSQPDPNEQNRLATIGDKSFFVPRKEAVDIAQKQAQNLEEDKLIQQANQTAFSQQGATTPNPFPQAEQIPQDNLMQGKQGIVGSVLSKPLQNTAQAEIIFKKVRKGVPLSSAEQQQFDSLGLNELDIQNLKEGQASINGLARITEGIPIIGKLRARGEGFHISVSELVGGGGPSDKVDEILSNIKSASVTMDTAIAVGDFTTGQSIANEIIKMESRIKLLGIQSPEIQGNPDRSNDIREEILNVKLKNPAFFPT